MSKLQSVRGTHDLFGQNASKHQVIAHATEYAAKLYGYSPIATPIIEPSDVFHRTLGETSDVVSKETYTFEDRGGEKITMRPEGTAGVVRSLIEHGRLRELPVRHFYNGPMFRYERPQKGRQRQFHQIGFELFGVESYLGDVELISLAWNFLKNLNLSGELCLEVNSIGDQESRKSYREALIQFLNGFESKLSEDSKKRLITNPLRILDSKDKGDQDILKTAPQFNQYLTVDSNEFFENVKAGLEALNIPFTVNPRLVRGLDYYRHCVFEVKNSSLGAQDTLLGGGRYDGLVDMMGGPTTAAVGWAAGIERLALLMPDAPSPSIQVFVVSLENSCDKYAIQIAEELRRHGVSAEIPYSGNVSKKLKKADKAGVDICVLIGSNEANEDKVTIKHLKSNSQQASPRKNLVENIKKLLS